MLNPSLFLNIDLSIHALELPFKIDVGLENERSDPLFLTDFAFVAFKSGLMMIIIFHTIVANTMLTWQ